MGAANGNSRLPVTCRITRSPENRTDCEDEAAGRDQSDPGMDQAAFGQRHRAEQGAGMEKEHGSGRQQPRDIGFVCGHRGDGDARRAQQPGSRDQDAQRPAHATRSFNSRATAARNSAMPLPAREEVDSTWGKAAGCLASSASVSAVRAASSPGLTWSALVRTIW